VNKVGGPIGPQDCSNWSVGLIDATTLRMRPMPELALAMGDQHRVE
jgi:hypothetical protein